MEKLVKKNGVVAVVGLKGADWVTEDGRVKLGVCY